MCHIMSSILNTVLTLDDIHNMFIHSYISLYIS